jgi:hypothetical protein
MAFHPGKRQALIDFCNRHTSSHDGQLPVVTIEQFFDGNDDFGSIMCNLRPPSIAAVRDLLLTIRNRPDVESVLIAIHETMEEDDEAWPFADQVLIVTAADPSKVMDWFPKDLAPDDVSEVAQEVEGVPRPREKGAKVLVAWWD